jgi:hypothetical protein
MLDIIEGQASDRNSAMVMKPPCESQGQVCVSQTSFSE